MVTFPSLISIQRNFNLPEQCRFWQQLHFVAKIVFVDGKLLEKKSGFAQFLSISIILRIGAEHRAMSDIAQKQKTLIIALP